MCDSYHHSAVAPQIVLPTVGSTCVSALPGEVVLVRFAAFLLVICVALGHMLSGSQSSPLRSLWLLGFCSQGSPCLSWAKHPLLFLNRACCSGAVVHFFEFTDVRSLNVLFRLAIARYLEASPLHPGFGINTVRPCTNQFGDSFFPNRISSGIPYCSLAGLCSRLYQNGWIASGPRAFHGAARLTTHCHSKSVISTSSTFMGMCSSSCFQAWIAG